MAKVRSRLADRGLELILTEGAKDFLIAKGYNPDYGARPLRRSIENMIEDPLSEEILRGSFKGMDLLSVKLAETPDELATRVHALVEDDDRRLPPGCALTERATLRSAGGAHVVATERRLALVHARVQRIEARTFATETADHDAAALGRKGRGGSPGWSDFSHRLEATGTAPACQVRADPAPFGTSPIEPAA